MGDTGETAPSSPFPGSPLVREEGALTRHHGKSIEEAFVSD
jgi:hypothetical protein